MATIKGIIVEIGGDTASLQSALKTVNTTLKTTQAATTNTTLAKIEEVGTTFTEVGDTIFTVYFLTALRSSEVEWPQVRSG